MNKAFVGGLAVMKPFATVTVDESKCCPENPSGVVIVSNVEGGPLAVINMLAAGISQMTMLAQNESTVVMADGSPVRIGKPSQN